jgi:hypothetical protein
MLAGGAPLLGERLRTRGGPSVDLRDPWTFYDNSSFGPDALRAFARIVGAEQVLYGSDRPVLEPLPGARDVLLWSDAERLFTAPVVAA